MTDPLKVVELCAGAGGQGLGLEEAGFEHELAVELDANACATLRLNRPEWKVVEGDVADESVWDPSNYAGVDLLAGGVPCPPFTIAGKQLGATDERDLFAWAVETAGRMKPRALMLENVRGLSSSRFAGYRQHVLDRLAEFGYTAQWKLLQASDFGVPQLRPRFVLVALRNEDFPYFSWPESSGPAPTVGEALLDEMSSLGWEGATEWAANANRVAPTIVGGSKKHGGADLGPTRAKRAWALLGVDALGVADSPPAAGDSFTVGPRLTTAMVSVLQGWPEGSWNFAGKKTAKYRQIGNAFPPPVAAAVGSSISKALLHLGEPRLEINVKTDQDPIFRVLRKVQRDSAGGRYVTQAQIERSTGIKLDAADFEHRMALLARDFDVRVKEHASTGALAYQLGDFRAFTGQEGHIRNELFSMNRSRIS